jgi:hypothetical protein
MRTIADLLLTSLIAAILLGYLVSALINWLPLMPTGIYVKIWIATAMILWLMRESKPSPGGDGFLLIFSYSFRKNSGASGILFSRTRVWIVVAVFGMIGSSIFPIAHRRTHRSWMIFIAASLSVFTNLKGACSWIV